MGTVIFPPIPLKTVKAAYAVFGRSNFYLAVGDQVDDLFAGLLQGDGPRLTRSSDWSLAMLYLITIFQFIETLPDHLAADALHERVEWKYALHLPLNYLSLDVSEFCKFRRGLRVSQPARQDLQTLLQRLSETTSFGRPHSHNLEADQVISAVCQISRLGKIWEALNQTLEVLATRQPDWLLANSLPHWYERYSRGSRNLNLNANNLEARDLAQGIGADGYYLLHAISKIGDPELAGLVEVRNLRRIWVEEYNHPSGKIIWKRELCVNCSSPGEL